MATARNSSGARGTGKKAARTHASAAKKSSRHKYGPESQKKVKEEMHEFKRGKLKMGRSGKKVKSREQAIAIGLSEARREGAKVPHKKAA